MMKPASLALLLLLASGVCLAHDTWISVERSQLKQGESITVEIGHGHFPVSDMAPAASDLRVFAVAPSGKVMELKAARSGKVLAAAFKAAETGAHQFYFLQDRGVLSRTPKGVQPGGRDKNPTATATFRMVRAGAIGPVAKPFDIPFQLVGQVTGGKAVLQAFKDGKPCAGVSIGLALPGTDAKKLGVTGADGRYEFVPGGVKGAVLFVATLSEKARPEAGYDTGNYSAALELRLP